MNMKTNIRHKILLSEFIAQNTFQLTSLTKIICKRILYILKNVSILHK